MEEIRRLLREQAGRLGRIETELEQQGGELGALTQAARDRQPVMTYMAELAKEAGEWGASKRDLHKLLLTWPTTKMGGLSTLLLAAALAGWFGLDVPAAIAAYRCQDNCEGKP